MSSVAAIKQLPASLLRELQQTPKIVIAYSGGVDSRFLAQAASLAGCEIFLLQARGPHISTYDTQAAINWAKKNAFVHDVVDYDPLLTPNVANNSRQRCYFCKKTLFAKMSLVLESRGLDGWQLCDGSHADDLKNFRPGQQAIHEMGIRSPLALAGLNKKDIRASAKKIGLDNWDQPSGACLLTRLAYGLNPAVNTLRNLAACEEEIARLLKKAHICAEFRIRLTPDPVLQWSEKMGPLRNDVQKIMTPYGWGDAVIYEDQPVSGFFDRQI